MGPKFGKDMSTITKLLAEQPAKELALAVAQGKNVILQGEANQWELEPADIVVVQNLPEDLVLNDSAPPVLIVDTEITDELRREGLARDIVRHIQQIRKDIELEIQDHITLRFQSSQPDVRSAITEHETYISQETLCEQISGSDIPEAPNAKEVKIGTGAVRFAVAKCVSRQA